MKLLKIIIYTLIISLFLIITGDFIIKIYFNSALLYNGDFYINYHGGFVRRGLDGELLFQLSKITGQFPWQIFKFYSLIFLVAFFMLTIYFIIKFNIPLLFILSMSGLLLYLNYSLPLRKDHLVLSLFMVLFIIIRKRRINVKTILLVNLFLIIGTLIHEIFLLICFFPILITLILKNDFKKNLLKNLFIFFSLPILIFCLSAFLAPGNSDQKAIIINSWSNLGLHNISFNVGIFEESLYIWKYNRKIWQYFYLLAILIINFLFTFCSIFLIKPTKPQMKIFFIILISQYFITILLCIVAIDYARWIFIANFTSVIAFYQLNDFKQKQVETVNIIHGRIYTFLAYFLYYFATAPFTTAAAENLDKYYVAMPINILKNIITKNLCAE